MAAMARIGTSGFMYDHWRGVLYPQKLAKAKWLEHYATQFDTVELNNTFYGMPRARICQTWHDRTGEGFCFAVKLHRVITHRRRLVGHGPALAAYLEAVAALDEKLGPILVQLPPRFTPDPQRLDRFLESCPPRHRWAVEFRDPAWLNDEVFAVLARHNAALVIHDLIRPHPQTATADWTYFRFHGPAAARYAGRYPPQSLRAAADRILGHLSAGRDVYAYFNNDIAGHAVLNAMDLRRFVNEG